MTKTKYIAAQTAWQEMVELKVGDKVLVCREAVKGEFGWDNSWPEVMNDALYHEDFDKHAKVDELGSDENGIMLTYVDNDGDQQYHVFPFFVLEKVISPLPAPIKISSSYEAMFKADGSIVVGCQKIPFTLLESIYESAKSVIVSK